VDLQRRGEDVVGEVHVPGQGFGCGLGIEFEFGGYIECGNGGRDELDGQLGVMRDG
jgi:hypothetical protein